MHRFVAYNKVGRVRVGLTRGDRMRLLRLCAEPIPKEKSPNFWI